MTSIIERMRRGTHRGDTCGSNRSGFSAINALPMETDFHTLNSSLLCQVPVHPSVRPKMNMLSCDILAYLIAKIFSVTSKYTTYTFLLRSQENNMSVNILNMISYMSYHAFVYTVSRNGDSYNIVSRFRGQVANISVSSFDELKKLTRSMNDRTSSMYIVYPDLTEDYISLLNSLNKCMWCIPSSRSSLYVSDRGTEHYSPHIYPWSTSKRCAGYIVGQEKIRRSSRREMSLYIGAFGYYEKFVSCTPYKGSCPDCYEMKRSTECIAKMMGLTITTTVSERRMSPASVVSLERMKVEFNEYCGVTQK
jgi:hypothetical protein